MPSWKLSLGRRLIIWMLHRVRKLNMLCSLAPDPIFLFDNCILLMMGHKSWTALIFYRLKFPGQNDITVQPMLTSTWVWIKEAILGDMFRDQARGWLGRNSRPRGRNFVLNGTQGEVGVSLKKKFFFFFFWGETHFHSVTTQMQAVVTLSDSLLPLHRVSPSIKWQ